MHPYFDFPALFAHLTANYAQWLTSGREPTPVQAKMIQQYKDGLGIMEGRRFIRIVKDKDTDAMSVWGFVVSVLDDKKFVYGDILKAHGWLKPATNKARGSMVANKFYHLPWTSAH